MSNDENDDIKNKENKDAGLNDLKSQESKNNKDESLQ